MPATHRKVIAKLLTILGSLMLSIFASTLRSNLTASSRLELMSFIVLGFFGLILIFISLLLEY